MKPTVEELARAALDAVDMAQVPVTTPAPGVWLLGDDVRIRRLPRSSRSRWAVDERHAIGQRAEPDWAWMEASANRANAAYRAVALIAYREREDRILAALEKAIQG